MEVGIYNIAIDDTYLSVQRVVPPHEIYDNLLLEDGFNLLLEDGGVIIMEDYDIEG